MSESGGVYDISKYPAVWSSYVLADLGYLDHFIGFSVLLFLLCLLTIHYTPKHPWKIVMEMLQFADDHDANPLT